MNEVEGSEWDDERRKELSQLDADRHQVEHQIPPNVWWIFLN